VTSWPSEVEDFELSELSILDLQEAMESGRWTARDITTMYLERIDAIDRQGPELRSVLEVNPDALAIADHLDQERQADGPRGPLHGIPVLLKDNIATSDRMTTTAGSLALEGCIAPRDSEVARCLREAGAILLGKTNLSEWANFRSSHASSGWSGRGGQCRNPFALDRNPCGSSSGSGAATSASLAALSLGTETDGSIVCPANANGLVGVKPTVGLVSRSGIIPISRSQDTAGPMTRTVADAAALLGVLVSVDPEDHVTSGNQERSSLDYTLFLEAGGLTGARIGVARQFFGFHPGVDAVLDEALDAMKHQGAQLLDPVDFATRGEFGDAEYAVLLYEFKADLNRFLADLGPDIKVRNLTDLIRFNEENASREMQYFGQDIFSEAESKGDLASSEYLKALETCRKATRGKGIDAVMDEHRLDAIVAPTGGPAWTTDLINGDHFLGGSSSFAAVAGYPNITVPAGFVHELPIGLSFFGRPWSEPKLLRLAFAFEQATRARRAPEFKPSVAV
jgi:amidase